MNTLNIPSNPEELFKKMCDNVSKNPVSLREMNYYYQELIDNSLSSITEINEEGGQDFLSPVLVKKLNAAETLLNSIHKELTNNIEFLTVLISNPICKKCKKRDCTIQKGKYLTLCKQDKTK